ncbi:transposase [Streptomyces sp. NPDC051658]|uniref:transposase n=1 Tax=Streptomyces sp. NPDC051658 TaxID=3365667 RepID=UPI0037B34217
MPKYAPNRFPTQMKSRYFELIRSGLKGAAAARQVGVSTSCGSKWFIEAGSVNIPDEPVSSRFLTQDERIAIAEALHVGTPVSKIAERIGKHRTTIYREIERGTTADGTYQPWWSHNQTLLRRKRPKEEKLLRTDALREEVKGKLEQRWSPQQISRHLARHHPDAPDRRVCPETTLGAFHVDVVPCRGELGELAGGLLVPLFAEFVNVHINEVRCLGVHLDNEVVARAADHSVGEWRLGGLVDCVPDGRLGEWEERPCGIDEAEIGVFAALV